jgi:4-hydroxybenzoyl-CoA thioesterase
MLVSQKRIVVEYGHCGLVGIVYSPQYMKWFDACTCALFDNAGLPLPHLFKEQGVVGIPIVKLETRFLLPVTYGEELLAESTVTRWGKSSFVIHHLFLKCGVSAVEGFETRVWTARDPANADRIRSRPLPSEVVDRLSVPRTVVANT